MAGASYFYVKRRVIKMTNVISMLIGRLVFICNGYSIIKNLAKIKNIHLTVNKSTVKALLQVSAVLITAMCAGAGIIVSVAPDTGSIVGFGLAAAAIAVYFTAKNSAEKLAVAKLLMLGSVGCYVGILGIMQNVELTENAWGWLVGLKAQSDGFKTAIFGTLIPLLFVETDEPPVQKVGRWFTRQSIRTYFWCMRQLGKVNALLERAASTARAHLCALCQTVKSSINSVFAELAKLGSAVLDCLAGILTPLISHLVKAAACAGAILLLTVSVSIQPVTSSNFVTRTKDIWQTGRWRCGRKMKPVSTAGRCILKRRRSQTNPTITGGGVWLSRFLINQRERTVSNERSNEERACGRAKLSWRLQELRVPRFPFGHQGECDLLCLRV